MPTDPPSAPISPRWRLALACGGLMALVLLLYWRVGRYEFVSYDDPDYITRNPRVQSGLTAQGIRWAFTELHGEATYWHPITWMSHMLDCQLFGLNAGGHHLVNVLIHGTNAVLLLILLQGMTGALWRSWMVAAIFALHPIQVDTVAWIAERKNVLSTMFLFVTLLCYTKYARKPSARWYFITLLCYAVGLMTKPMLVTVPGILLLLDYWPLRRFRLAERGRPISSPLFAVTSIKRLLLEKAPFAVMAIISAAITVRAHQALGMEQFSRGLPLGLRLENAIVSYARYIGKILAPHNLAVFYPHPQHWAGWLLTGSIILLVAISFAAVRGGKRYPFIAIGWLWFLGTLVPVLGIIQAGLQAMADRFAYVPMIGFVVMLVWGLAEILQTRHRLAIALSTVAVAACITASGMQLRYWRNNESLWRHTLAVTKDNPIAEYGLAYVLIEQENYDEALLHTQEALRLRPDLIEAYYQLAVIKDRQGKFEEAIPKYKEALQMKWDWAEAHRALLSACYRSGKTNVAIEHLKKLVQTAPNHPGGHLELAQALNSENRIAEEIEEYRQVVRLAPLWATPRNNLAWILATHPDPKLRNAREAVDVAERACELTEWKQSVMIGTLAAAYAENGEFAKAVKTAERAAASADSTGQKDIAERNRQLLELYKQKKPYHEGGQ